MKLLIYRLEGKRKEEFFAAVPIQKEGWESGNEKQKKPDASTLQRTEFAMKVKRPLSITNGRSAASSGKNSEGKFADADLTRLLDSLAGEDKTMYNRPQAMAL